MNHTARHPRKRLGFWRFLLALLLGLGIWWAIAWCLKSRPLWTIRYPTPKDIIMPICESDDGKRIGVIEMRLPQRQTGNPTMTALAILNARSGTTLYRLPLQDKAWDSDEYSSFHWAQPRILGDIHWRVTRTISDSEVRFELRAWHYTQNRQEHVVHVWKGAPGANFEIAFANSRSPYFITQTAEPWEPLLVGMGVEGWSRLLATMAFTGELNALHATMRTRHPRQFIKRGLVLPRIQTWKLPTSLDAPLQQLASWTMPPMRIAWPPACAPDLHWVAFGDLESYQEWNVDRANTSIKPQGVMLHDGHTGAPRSLSVPADGTLRASAAGELLLISSHHNVFSHRVGTSEHPVYEGSTGKQLAWPAEVKHPFTPKDLLADDSRPGRYLALMGILADGVSTTMVLSDEIQHIIHLQRTENGFTLVKDVTLQTQPGQVLMFPAHFSGSEMGVYATVDTAPPFLRPLIEKWDWFKTIAQKFWPPRVPSLLLYDIDSGKQVRQLLHLVPSININSADMRTQFTSEIATDLPPGSLGYLNLAAWQLPITAQGWSPWWSRIAGIVIFLAAICLLRRRTTPHNEIKNI